jgi:hypothetical protein
MSNAVTNPAAPADAGVANASRAGLEAGTNNSRGERKFGNGRRRREAAEQRRIEQQRWSQYVEEEDEDFSVAALPSSRRRARRAVRRNAARDDLEEYLNGLANDDHITGLEDDLDFDMALAMSFSIAEQNACTRCSSRSFSRTSHH